MGARVSCVRHQRVQVRWLLCCAIPEGDVALAVRGCWAMGMGVRTLCHRWVNYCMGYGRLASFMCGLAIVGEGRGERGHVL